MLWAHCDSTGFSDFSLETNRIQVPPVGDPTVVEIIFLADSVTEEGTEGLTLDLLPTPSTLQTIPIGEAVFFKNAINLTIVDAGGMFD